MPRSAFLLPVTILLVAGCQGPSQADERDDPGVPSTISTAEMDARRSLFLVEPEALREELRTGSGPVVLEVGTNPEAFESEGHLPGAGFLPWTAVAVRKNGLPNMIPDMEVLRDQLSRLGVGDDSRIVLYDRGQGLMAGRAWAVLDYAGLGDRSRVLNGQLTGWLAEGGELEMGAASADEASTLTLRPEPSRVLAVERLDDVVWARSFQASDPYRGLHLLDARPAAEFTGEVAGDEVIRPGHIPGARNLPWRSTTGPDEAPFLMGTVELLDLFVAAGVAPGDRIYTYCRTGGQAGHLYFVARMLGFEAHFHDGSFVEWSRAPERPVARP